MMPVGQLTCARACCSLDRPDSLTQHLDTSYDRYVAAVAMAPCGALDEVSQGALLPVVALDGQHTVDVCSAF